MTTLRSRSWSCAALLLGAVSLFAAPVRAQESANWTSQLVVQPFPSPFLSAWERNPHVAILTVVYTGSGPRDFRIEGRAESLERGFVARAQSAPNQFGGGPSTQIFSSQEIMNWYTVESDQAVFDQVLRTGVLPEGRWRLCARVIDNADVVLTESCAEFTIELPAPPQLISPADRSVVPTEQPVFQWTPVVVPPELGVTYRVRIVERLGFQTPADALDANRAVHEDEIAGAPLLVYPRDGLPLEEGREYVWQVEALDGAGLPITTGARRSEIWAFTPGDPLNPAAHALPDTLILVPGVAMLTGVSSVHATNFGSTYTLDGDLRLEMLTPSHVAVDVRAEALTLDAATLSLPQYVSGRLVGEFSGGAFAGSPVAFTSVTYSPSSGIGLKGELRLPDGRTLPLDGEARLGSSGLSGRLTARGGAAPLAVFGGDPVRYEMRELSFTFPDMSARAEGRLEVLGREAAGCGRIDFMPGAHGPFTASVDCAINTQFELAPAAGGVTLALSRVDGWLSGDWAAAALTYDLGLDGVLTVAPPGAAAYRFDAGLRARNGTAELSRLAASASGGAATDGWLGAAPELMVAPRFTYSAGGAWDFELRFRGAPTLPRFPSITLPQVEVAVDRAGVSMNGFSTTFANAPVVELGGFAVRPLAASMSPLNVRWSDGVAAVATVSADLEIGFADDTPQPLGDVKLIGRGLGFSNGAWTGALQAQTYQPGIDLKFGGDDDAVFRVSSLSGQLSGSAGEQAVAVSAAGALFVPEYMRCGALPQGAIEIGSGALTLSSAGVMEGAVSLGDFACPLTFGPMSVTARNAQLTFGSSANGPRLELDMAADVRLPGEQPGTWAFGSGALGMDLLGPSVLRGSVDIAGGFRLDLPAVEPVLSFVVPEARLSSAGLSVSGRGVLTLADASGGALNDGNGSGGPSAVATTQVTADFNALTLSLPRFRISSGNAQVKAPIAFRLAADAVNNVTWQAVTPPEGVAPLELTLDAQGARFNGSTSLTLDILERTFPLAVQFQNGFRLAVDSTVEVTDGRGSIRLDTTEVAYVDATGFWLTGTLDALGELFPDFEMPERLALPTEDVAYLELQPNGVTAVDVSFSPAGVQLYTRPGQNVNLVVPAFAGAGQPPTIATSFALAIDPETHAVTGGSLVVDGNGAVLFTAQQNGFDLDITQLRFEADSLGAHRMYFTGAADVMLTDGQSVRVAGELRHSPMGLDGVLRAAAGDDPLLLLGSDALRLSVDSATLTLPELDFDVQAGLELFGRDANCVTSFAGPRNAQGLLTGTASCAPGVDVPLVEDAPDVALRLNTITGSVSLDPSSSGVSAQLTVGTALTLARDESGASTCGANLSLLVNGASINVDPASVSVQCGGPARSRGFGWFDAEPGNLSLERLSYTAAAGFDFEVRADLDLTVRDVIDVPALASVMIDTAGIHLPSLDTPVTHAPVKLGGFGLNITRVITPAYLVPWLAWQDGQLREFEVELDAQLSMPDLPQGYPACLATSAFPASRVSINYRRLRVELPEHTFAPACAITLDASTSADTTTDDEWANPFGYNSASDEWLAPPLVDAPPVTAAQSAAMFQTERTKLLTMEDSLRQHVYAEPCDTLCEKFVKALIARADSMKDTIFAARFRREVGHLTDSIAALMKNASAAGVDPDMVRVFEIVGSGRAIIEAGLASATDCSDIEYYSRALLTLERQSQLMGGGSDDSAITELSEPFDRCAQQRDAELAQACQTPGNRAPLLWSTAQVLGLERQRQLLGTADDDNAALTQVGDCFNQVYQFDLDHLQQLCATSPNDSAAIYSAMQRVLSNERQLQLLGAGSEATDYVSLGCDGTSPQASAGAGGGYAASSPVNASSSGAASSDGPTYGGGYTARGRIETLIEAVRGFRLETADTTPAPTFPLTLQLEKFGGALVVAFGPAPTVEQLPWVEGSLVLPQVFTCTNPADQSLAITTRLQIGARGDISGTALGVIPQCPIELPALEIQITESSLIFSTKAGEQKAVLRGAATGSFTAADAAQSNNTVTGSGNIEIDLLRARLIDGELSFQGPFVMDLPRAQPLVSLELGSAKLNRSGLHVNGSGDLIVGANARIGATLDNVTIDPLNLALTAGRIDFAQPFALEIGIGTESTLGWRAVPAGSTPATQTGARVDLPTNASLTPNGFEVNGAGAAHLLYEGQNMASLDAAFSEQFSIALNPPRVRTGVLDFQLNGNSVAYIDEFGFHPNLLAFGLAALPARLPLPTETTAYLELRDTNGDLRVDVQNVNGGVRIQTLQTMVPLVVPALSLGGASGAADPRVDVMLDVTLDPATGALTSGYIAAAVPQGAPGFDLTAAGLPLAIDSLLFRDDGDGYALMLAARLTAFGPAQPGAGTVRLALDPAGRLSGQLSNVALQQNVQLVPGSQNATFDVSSVSGWFDAQLLQNQLAYQLDFDTNLRLAQNGTELIALPAIVRASHSGLQVTDLNTTSAQPFTLAVDDDVQLTLDNVRVPVLGYTVANGWQFEMLFDAALRFPQMQDFVIGPIDDVVLSHTGFTIPAIELADLEQKLSIGGIGATAASTGNVPYAHLLPALPDTLKFGGFTFRPLAFRMDAVSYNWFTNTLPQDWGFGFDFEIELSELHAQAPQSLKDLKLRLLDAGLRNGRPSGQLERVSFPETLDAGVVQIAAAWGWIMPPPEERPEPEPEEEDDPDEPVIIHLEVGVDLYSPVPVCPSAARVNVHNDTLSISSDGWLRGRIQGITPTCDQDLGPFRFEFGNSELRFAAGTEQQLEILTTGTIFVDGVSTDEVSASGMLRFDALQGQILAGRIELNEPFRWQPADGNPFLTFDVNSAALDMDGFHFAAGGSMRLEGGATAAVSFNNLTLALPTFEIAAGNITVQNQIALGTTIDANGALTWGAFAPSAPRAPGWGFRAVLPSNLVIDAGGLGVTGTATAELSFADTVFQAIEVDFVNDFTIGMQPVGVSRGRANFTFNNSLVAHADSLGFWPGNIFAALPIPDTLDLGGRDVAYIVLRDPATGQLNVQTETSANGIRLQTTQNQMLPLIVPALAANNGGAPATNIALDIVVNQNTYQVASGSITAESPDGAPPLLSLAHVGVPLDVRKLAYGPTGPNGSYALAMNAAVQLPAGMCPSTQPLLIEDFSITSGGISGSTSFGTLTSDTTAPAIVTCAPSTDLAVELVGAEVTLGGQNPGVQLAGRMRTPFFTSNQGVVRPIVFDGTLTTANGLTLNVDPNLGKLPLGFGTFEPVWVGQDAPLSVVANANEFTVTLNGVFGDLPALPQDFGLTVSNLRIGTAGVSLQGLGLTGDQEIQLWASTLRLKQSTCNGSPVAALSGSYINNVFQVELAGELEFMENTSTFCGLRIASTGTLELASANLLSQPVVITEDVIALETLRIENSNLLGTVAVTVPEPIMPAGTPAQLVNFSVTPQGQVTGGGTVVVVNDGVAGLANDSTEYALGSLVTVDPRYLGITLDFTPTGFRTNSKVEVVSDFYLKNESQNLIQLGSMAGNQINAGLTVGFNGNVTWGNVAMPNPFEFDYDVVRFGIGNVTATGTGLDDFAIGFDGGLGLTISQVSGDLEFTGAKIRSTGDVEFGQVKGGAFSIAGMASFEVSDFAYVDSDTTIVVSSGGLPTGNGTVSGGETQINVDRLLRFGASISVADAFSGEVDDFLVYRTSATSPDPGLTSLIVSGAKLNIDGVVDVGADLRYRELSNGFELLVGGSANVLGTAGLTVVGAMQKTGPDIAAGMFLAADGLTGINLTPATPVVGLSGIGGGFFLNPKQEWLDVVKSQSGVTEGAPDDWGSAPAGDFAVLLYAALGAPAPPADVVTGKVLLTVMPTAIEINGRVVLLKQEQRLFGVGQLVVLPRQAKVSGNVRLEAGYAGLLSAEADISFIGGVNAFGQPTALLNGDGSITAVNYFTANGSLAAGPWGFMGGLKVGNLPSLGLVSLDSATATVFMIRGPTLATTEWGGIATITAAAGPIPSVSPVKVTLQGAVLAQGVSMPVLYAMGEAHANYIFGEWKESVWARVSDGQIDAGFGSDAAMQDAINRSLALANDIASQKDAAEQSVASAPAPQIVLSDQEMLTVYNNLSAANSKWHGTSLQSLFSLEIQESNGRLVPYDGHIIKARGAMWRMTECCSTTRIAQLKDTANARSAAVTAARPQVQQRLSAIQATLSASNVAPSANVPSNGVTATFADPIVQTITDANGDTTAVITGGPQLTVDVQALTAMQSALLQHQSDRAALDQQVQQQITDLETLLANVRGVLTDTAAGSVVQFAGAYASAVSALERRYAEHGALLLDASDRGRLERDSINGRTASFSTLFNAHLDSLVNNPTTANRLRLKALAIHRVNVLDEMQGTHGAWKAIVVDTAGRTEAQKLAHFRLYASQAGWILWHDAVRAGAMALDTTSLRMFAESKAEAEPQLNAMRAAHAQLSDALTPLYDGQAELTGVLYDLVDRYVAWKNDGAARFPSGGAGADPLYAQKQLRKQLAQDLTVPTITGVTVTSKVTRHLAELTFNWQATHPNSLYQFLFRDSDGSLTAGTQSLFAGGQSGSLQSYRARSHHGTNGGVRTLQVGARGGAGFVGTGHSIYGVNFLPENTTEKYPVITTAGTLKADSTPPPAPGVSFPGMGIHQNFAWTNDPSGFAVAWSTDDPQSGISEYAYALGTAPGDSSLRAWTTVGGRTGMRIDGVTLSASTPVYVAVRARNGSGVWSSVGTSSGVRVDQVAPYFAPGATLEKPHVISIAQSAQSAYTAWTPQLPTVAACTPQLPPFPVSGGGTSLTIGGGFSSGGMAPQPAGDWNGSLSSGVTSVLSSSTTSQPSWTGTPPSISLVRPTASDALAGVDRYEFRVDTVPTSSWSPQGWTHFGGQEFSVSGAPMDYHRTFFVSVVAVDYAGNASAPVVYGPFTPYDATPPTDPVFCASTKSGGLVVRFDSISSDGESGVRGYQFRVRDAGGNTVRNWPSGATPDWQGVVTGGVASVSGMSPQSGQSYFVDVRPVNMQNRIGAELASGLVVHDVTPPPAPHVVGVKLAYGIPPKFQLTVSLPQDPESSLWRVQYAVGSTQGATNLIDWQTTGTSSTLLLPATGGMSPTGQYWLQIRTVNKAGLASAVKTYRFTSTTIQAQ